MVAAGIQAVAAIPLIEEGRTLGVIWVGSARVGRTFDRDDVETLEIMAGIAAAAMVGLERARLEGVLLAARTAEHEVNNRLAATVGYAELLATDPKMPTELQELANAAFNGARSAAEVVQRLRAITRLEETDWGPNQGTTIDLRRSDAEVGAPQASR
jgi:GAF domain-containing protein